MLDFSDEEDLLKSPEPKRIKKGTVFGIKADERIGKLKININDYVNNDSRLTKPKLNKCLSIDKLQLAQNQHNLNGQIKPLTKNLKLNYKRGNIFVLRKRIAVESESMHTKIHAKKKQRRIEQYPCFDSGAALHASSDWKTLVDPVEINEPIQVYDAGGNCHYVQYVGRIYINAQTADNYPAVVQIPNVFYTPTINGIFIDTTRLRLQDGWKCCGDKLGMDWHDPTGNRFRLKLIFGNEYLVGKLLTKEQASKLTPRSANCINGFVAKPFLEKIKELPVNELVKLVETDHHLTKWELHESRIQLAKAGTYIKISDRDPLLALHHALGHVNWRVVAKYAKEHGIELPLVAETFCQACLRAKHKKRPRGKPTYKKPTAAPYEQWSADVFGPVRGTAFNKIQYQLLFVDRATNTVKSYALSDLRHIPDTIAKWIHEIRTEISNMNVTGINIQLMDKLRLRADSATYFKSNRTAQILQREKVQITFSPPHTQWQNAFAERTIATIKGMAKALIKASGLDSHRYWACAWQHAVLLYDWLPRNANKDSKSPYETRTGLKPPLITSTVQPFGAKCSVHIPETHLGAHGELSGKFHKDKSRPGIIVGWDLQSNSAIIAIHEKTALNPRLIKSAQFVVSKQLPSQVYEGNVEPLPEEHDHYYYPLEEILPTEHEILDHNKKNDNVEKSSDSDEETYEVVDQAARQADEFVPDLPTEGQNDDNMSETSIDEISNDKEIDIDNSCQNEKSSNEISSQTAQTDTMAKLNLKKLNKKLMKKVIKKLNKKLMKKVKLKRKNPNVAYSLKQAIKMFPEFESHLRKAAMTEIEGLINKCLKQFSYENLKENEKVQILRSLYSIKYEGIEFDKAKYKN